MQKNDASKHFLIFGRFVKFSFRNSLSKSFLSKEWYELFNNLMKSVKERGVFSMVIWSLFRIGQYKDNCHREDAPHFIWVSYYT